MATLAVNRRMPSSESRYYPYTPDLFTLNHSSEAQWWPRAPLLRCFRPNTEQEESHV